MLPKIVDYVELNILLMLLIFLLTVPLAEKVCPEVPLEDCPPGQAYVKDYKDGCPVYKCGKCIIILQKLLIKIILGFQVCLSKLRCDTMLKYKTFFSIISSH